MSNRVKVKTASYEVVVIGGGLSGMCAAIAAARHGAKTALIHGRHVFGGNASSEIRMHICGASENMEKADLEEGGILYEMMLENKSRNDYYSFSIWDMVLFRAVKQEPNLTAYLNTVMEDCETDGEKIVRIKAYQHTTETMWTIEGQLTLIPRFVMFSEVGLTNSHLALIVPNMIAVSATFMMRQYGESGPSRWR